MVRKNFILKITCYAMCIACATAVWTTYSTFFEATKDEPAFSEIIGIWEYDYRTKYDNELKEILTTHNIENKFIKLIFDKSECNVSNLPINKIFENKRIVNDVCKWRIKRGFYNEWQVELVLSNGVGVDFDVMRDICGRKVLVHRLLQPDQLEKIVLCKRDLEKVSNSNR